MTVKALCTCNNNDFIDMMCRHCLIMIRYVSGEMMKEDKSYRGVYDLATNLLEDR
jgi:hypothetical protein